MSHHTVDEVIALAHTLGVPVYTIGLCTDTNDKPCTLTEKGERALTRMADETGGLYTKVPDPNQLKGIYEKMAGMLKNQYFVTYESAACLAGGAAGSEHELKIRVVAGAAQGQDTKVFNCPTTCKR